MDIDRARLGETDGGLLRHRKTSDEEMRGIAPAAMVSTKRFDSVRVRGTLIKRGYLAQNVVRLLLPAVRQAVALLGTRYEAPRRRAQRVLCPGRKRQPLVHAHNTCAEPRLLFAAGDVRAR